MNKLFLSLLFLSFLTSAHAETIVWQGEEYELVYKPPIIEKMETEGVYKDGKKVKMKQKNTAGEDSKKVWVDEDEQEEDIEEQ